MNYTAVASLNDLLGDNLNLRYAVTLLPSNLRFLVTKFMRGMEGIDNHVQFDGSLFTGNISVQFPDKEFEITLKPQSDGDNLLIDVEGVGNDLTVEEAISRIEEIA